MTDPATRRRELIASAIYEGVRDLTSRAAPPVGGGLLTVGDASTFDGIARGVEDALAEFDDRPPPRPDGRIGGWVQTYGGGVFYPLDPRPEDVRIEDVARSLSMMCRYAGHTRLFYSVAEHSVLVSRAVPRELALKGLLHDAAEAYTADVTRPLKSSLRGWREMETRITAAVYERFGLPPGDPPELLEADSRIIANERAALLAPCAVPWEFDPGEPLDLARVGAAIVGLPPARAEVAFLRRFEELDSL